MKFFSSLFLVNWMSWLKPKRLLRSSGCALWLLARRGRVKKPYPSILKCQRPQCKALSRSTRSSTLWKISKDKVGSKGDPCAGKNFRARRNQGSPTRSSWRIWETNISRQTVDTAQDWPQWMSARRTLLLQDKHTKAHQAFAKAHLNNEAFCQILWLDENGVGWTQGRGFCLAKKGKAFNPRNTIPIFKHGGGNLMLWGCGQATLSN